MDKYKVKDVTEWEEEWFKSILPENNKLTLGFEKWDSEFYGKLRSKLCPVMGYGGTKKSLLAQQIAYKNIKRNDSRILYSTMEMGATNLISRLIDMECVGEKYNAHYEIEYNHNVTKRLDAKEFYKNIFSKSFEDKFFITEHTAMTCIGYDEILKEFSRLNKPIDILIVDGLSRMGGSGSETELYTKHSGELKDIANKYNIFVVLVCHVSKGGKKTDRDLSSLIRSSEKIIDNCDFYITNSLFDIGNSEYDLQYGVLRLVNKRGSGNIIDVVYDFDRMRLTMIETDKNVKDFENGF